MERPSLLIRRPRTRWLPLLMAMLLGALGAKIIGTVSSALATEADASPYANLGIFARALAHIEASHVQSPDQDALIYGAISGMVATLDPHSSFMNPDEYRVLTNDTQGQFGGIGVEVDVRDGWLVIHGVMEGGPASREGLEPGDRFLSIAGRRARDMPISDAVQLMRGEPGTRVNARIRREGEEDAIAVSLRRELIAVEAVEARLLPDRTLYVRIRSFQRTTTDELRAALDRATEHAREVGGLAGLLLDLRRNPGGLLHEAIRVSDEFLAEGVIVSTRGRDGQLLQESRAGSSGTRPSWPIVVLVDGYTASAAEIVAGALQDHGRATIVGSQTWGKGSVQNIIELPDGSALKLTIARYYTPQGRSIQAQGIAPDVVVDQVDAATNQQMVERALERFSEASLDRHLEGEGPPQVGRGLPVSDRHEFRREAERDSGGDSFSDDFQGRVAHEVLRALTLERSRSEASR